MIFKNDNIGLLVGTFFGSIIGTVGTMLVLKKMGKLEEKKLNQHEEEVVEEVRNYYRKKIEEIKKNTNSFPKCIEAAEKSVERSEEKAVAIVDKSKTRITFDNVDIKNAPKAAQQFDYSKISKEQYTDLKKEYEREEPIIEENQYPKQITRDEFERPGGYVKEELMYYEQNGIFTDMADAIVNHCTEKYFGADNLCKLGTPEATLDGRSGMFEIYLRDEEIHHDYHIILNSTDDFEHLGDCRDD